MNRNFVGCLTSFQVIFHSILFDAALDAIFSTIECVLIAQAYEYMRHQHHDQSI